MQLHHFGPGDEITWPRCTGHAHDPRADDGIEPLADWEARDAASESLMATPVIVAGWLAQLCAGHTAPLPLRWNADVEGLKTPTLLATLMAGNSDQALAALLALREQFMADHSQQIEALARDIFDEHNRMAWEDS